MYVCVCVYVYVCVGLAVYRLEYAAIALATKHINKYAGTIPVILARH